jgi:hypothetical protein
MRMSFRPITDATRRPESAIAGTDCTLWANSRRAAELSVASGEVLIECVLVNERQWIRRMCGRMFDYAAMNSPSA